MSAMTSLRIGTGKWYPAPLAIGSHVGTGPGRCASGDYWLGIGLPIQTTTNCTGIDSKTRKPWLPVIRTTARGAVQTVKLRVE
jgi:hypothetical protein